MTASSARLDVFLASLVQALDEATDHDLALAWSSSDRRTRYYRQTLMPRIAALMGLRPANEILQVDYSFHHTDSGVPLVFIESENDSSSALQEVGKLASLRAPLRVLFSVVPWSPDPLVWPPHGGMREQLLPKWTAEAKNYHDAYGDPSGAFIAVVGEWRRDETLHFFAHALGPVDEALLTTRDRPIWSRRMTVTQASAASAG